MSKDYNQLFNKKSEDEPQEVDIKDLQEDVEELADLDALFKKVDKNTVDELVKLSPTKKRSGSGGHNRSTRSIINEEYLRSLIQDEVAFVLKKYMNEIRDSLLIQTSNIKED